MDKDVKYLAWMFAAIFLVLGIVLLILNWTYISSQWDTEAVRSFFNIQIYE